jgi:hypothetical protein
VTAPVVFLGASLPPAMQAALAQATPVLLDGLVARRATSDAFVGLVLIGGGASEVLLVATAAAPALVAVIDPGLAARLAATPAAPSELRVVLVHGEDAAVVRVCAVALPAGTAGSRGGDA